MELHPVRIKKACIANDETIIEQVRKNLNRGLPVIGQFLPHDMVGILVGCGPSVRGQLDSIRRQKERGRPIIALVEAHDWLIDNGIIPNQGVAIDPQEKIFFHKVRDDVQYWIASQCHPCVFENLLNKDVFMWHIHPGEIANKVFRPTDKLIGGGTTSGLRTIVLLYSMGFQRIELYGFDSCLGKDGSLRMNGDMPKLNQKISPIKVGKRWFKCNPAMAAQAEEFETVINMMPDLVVQSHGDGLITAILEERAKITKSLVPA